jgi:hypothetical protein
MENRVEEIFPFFEREAMTKRFFRVYCEKYSPQRRSAAGPQEKVRISRAKTQRPPRSDK